MLYVVCMKSGEVKQSVAKLTANNSWISIQSTLAQQTSIRFTFSSACHSCARRCSIKPFIEFSQQLRHSVASLWRIFIVDTWHKFPMHCDALLCWADDLAAANAQSSSSLRSFLCIISNRVWVARLDWFSICESLKCLPIFCDRRVHCF